MTQPSPERALWKNYMFVNEKYYGINFTKIPKGYIEFRYLGGADYEKKYSTVLSMMEHFITSLYETLENPVYSSEDIKKLNLVLEKHRDVVQSYKTYSKFKEIFPNITLMVDLLTTNQIVEMYYPKIREKVFELLTKADMNNGLINYDSDTGRIQIKGANLNRCFEITNVDIVECKVKGNIKGCDIFYSELNDASLFESNVFGGSTINSCKVEDSYVSRNVVAENCYVFGHRGVFSGEMEGGIFRQGRATKFAMFSDSTEVIEIEKID